MKFNNLYKNSNVILIVFIIFLLAEAFDQSFGWGLNKIYPEIYFMTFGTKNEGWNEFIWFENGLIETIQITILLTTIFILLNLYFLKKKFFESALIKRFVIIEIFGLSYFFFEEISWGQHFINFDTFEFFLDKHNFFYNHQGEMNLHNTSRIFNEFPRIFVMIWCSLSIFIIPDLILTKLGIIDFSKLHVIENEIFKGFNLGTMLSVIFSFNFFRLSELQELLFAYYFLWHSLFLRNLYFK